MKRTLLLPILFFALFSCNKHTVPSNDSLKGIVTDNTGLDGCGMMIKLDNGTTLQPDVLPAGFKLEKDKRVILTYKIIKDKMSTCMAGTLAEIISISYL